MMPDACCSGKRSAGLCGRPIVLSTTLRFGPLRSLARLP